MLRVGDLQDDAHVFCRPDQLEEQLVEVLDLAEFMLKTFSFTMNTTSFRYGSLKTRRAISETMRYGSKQELALENALKAKNLDYQVDVGEAQVLRTGNRHKYQRHHGTDVAGANYPG